jgi:putative membrane protein
VAYTVAAMKTYLKTRLLPLCAGVLLITGSAVAQNVPTDTLNDNNRKSSSSEKLSAEGVGNRDSKIARSDRRFLSQAAHLGEKEVALSRIAAERATNPQVRAFASEMVTAHNAANTELAKLINQKGAQIYDRDLAIDQREIAKKWNEKTSANFDEDYLEAVIDGHQDTIDVLENGMDSKDAHISAYAGKLLPLVKSHLAHAEKLEDQVN